MKILHVAQILKGGTAAHLCELLPRQIAAWGPAQVRILAPADELDYLDPVPRGCVAGFASARRSPRALVALAIAARRMIRDEAPDIVHLHGTFAGAVVRASWLAVPGRRPPIVYCAHGWSFNMRVAERRRRAFAAIERRLAPLADRIACISRFELESALARGLPGDRLRLVYNGIAAEPPASDPPALPPAGERLRLLFLGRNEPQKGYDVLVEAMRRIGGAHVELHAVGPEARPGDPPGVIAHGWQPRARIPGFVAEADAVVVPSRWEGFGLVAAEAMRQRRAVLASAVDGLPELVEDGVTGRLVPPDDAGALATLLAGLDRATLRAMGAAGHEAFLARFTADRMADAIAALYEEVRRR